MTSLRLVWDDFPDREPYSPTASEVVTIGRSSQCQLCLPKDQRTVSRVHATIAHEDGGWHIRDQSSKGTFLDGTRIPASEPVLLEDGMRLGVGPFSLTVHLDPAEEVPCRDQDAPDAFDLSITQVDLARFDAERILSSTLELPGRLGEARGESEVFAVACRYLVNTLSPVIASAFVVLASADDGRCPQIVARYQRGLGTIGGDRLPAPAISRRLVERVVREPDSVVFLSRRHRAAPIDATAALSTNSLGACFLETGDGGRPVLLYTLGEQAFSEDNSLVAEYLKLVATLTKQHLLTLRRARMSKYFSPKVVEMLMQGGGASASQAMPQIVQATSFFFDLRGFSLSVEASASDLLELQEDLSAIITLVTQIVFEAGGTVIDYQGDAVFAAWGVPFPQDDQAALAARCALEIIHQLDETELGIARKPSLGRKAMCGIGLCKGEVLAGTVGSREMFKYGLLGPTVNASKRLEGLTKPSRLNAPVLCCEALAAELRSAGLRTRRVARVQLEGMSRIENVHELVDKSKGLEQTWHPEHEERWNTALATLEGVRAQEDLAALDRQLGLLPAQHPRSIWIRQMYLRLRAPAAMAQWDGVLRQ